MGNVNQPGLIRPEKSSGIDFFDFQVSSGGNWVSLNDHLNYRVGGDSFSDASQSRKRFTVQSSMYDGDWEVHSTASSVTENFVIDILGADQVMVSENILRLQAFFTQSVFNCRKVMDSSMETWRCFPAEWSLDRGMVQSHNIRAQMKLSVPRFPKIMYEAIT